MSWKLMEQQLGGGRSPWRIVDDAGEPVYWLNDFLDAQCVRGLAPLSVRAYARQLLHFGRWWSRLRRTWEAPDRNLIIDYIRAQLDEQPTPAASTVNGRLCLVSQLCRFHFGEKTSIGDLRLGHRYWRRCPLGYGRPRLAWSELRLKQPKPVITPLTAEQVGRFWASFHNCRDMALVALLLWNGLRSQEALTLRVEDVSFSEAQVRVRGKGRRERLLPLPPETLRLIDLYLRAERPQTSSEFLFVSLKGKARGQPMTRAGLRALFRYHRRTTGVAPANPHRFRHTFGADMVRAGVSLPALQQLMGHADIQTTMLYVYLTPADVWREYARAVERKALELAPR